MKKELQRKDFRIGNRIIYMGAEIVIEGINRNGDIDYTLNGHPYGGHNVKRYEPIPITEKYLLKQGLTSLKEQREKWYLDYAFVYSFEDEIKCSDYFIATDLEDEYKFCMATIDDGMQSYESFRRIKYVHELQNLFFALTGEELELKSETP